MEPRSYQLTLRLRLTALVDPGARRAARTFLKTIGLRLAQKSMGVDIKLQELREGEPPRGLKLVKS